MALAINSCQETKTDALMRQYEGMDLRENIQSIFNRHIFMV